MLNVEYRVIVRNPDNSLYEFDKASEVQWERYENNIGVCRFLLPATDYKLIASAISIGNYEIRIYRNTTLVFQGTIEATQDNKDGVVVFGLDYKNALRWYTIGRDTTPATPTYSSKKIGTGILLPIFDNIAARSDSIFGNYIVRGTIEDPYTTGTSTAKTITKTTFDEYFFDLLLDMVALSRSDSPSGAWKQDTVFNISRDEVQPVFTFLRNVGVDQPNVVLQLDSEIVDFDWVNDSRELRNTITGYTLKSDPAFLTSPQTDATSQSDNYRREISPVFEELENQAALDEKTKDFLKENKDGTDTIYAQFAPGLAPFDGYSMGDSVKVLIQRGRVAIDDFYRVVGMRALYTSGVEVATPLLQKKRT